MPGMNSGLSDTNPTLVAAFRTALLHQGLLIALLLAVLSLAWFGVREWMPMTAAARSQGAAGWRAASAEPAARRLLRIGFGIIWIFDGLLQAQPAMAAGLPSQVIAPAAASSPSWVQHLVNWAGTSWSYHPVQAGAAAVWIQVGLGAWLIAAPSGWASRMAGLASAGWGLVVWIFGEAFGGIFAPGLTFLFGAPGAVLFYCAAGSLLALPEARWHSARLGRQILAGLGLFLVGMAVLQAWPGRGFWQGRLHGQPGTLAAMVRSMASTPQPHFLSALVSGFANFDEAHGFAVNVIAVLALAAIGTVFVSAGFAATAFQTGRPRLIRPALAALLVLCLADWVLIEDLGFLGGVGTDPNSMIPVALIGVAGYLALVRVPAPVLASTGPAAESAPAVSTATGPTATDEPASGAAGLQRRPLPARLAGSFGAASLRAVVALWAVAIVIVGAGPMAAAQASPNANVIIAQSIDGNAAPLNFPAPGFTLTDQHGRQVSLASLRGKVVLLTFLDPVCTSDCPLIAQEFREADQVLGASSRHVELVAIVANPVYRSIAYTRAFDSQEGLSGLPNWLYLTGSLVQLRQAWKQYNIAAEILPAGGMIAHNDIAYVIDAAGHTRAELNFDPGPGTASSKSSFAAELAMQAQQVMGGA
jgi:cytochrome oxidase Cu insertion factor (SCO1/SenC/PrrC family)